MDHSILIEKKKTEEKDISEALSVFSEKKKIYIIKKKEVFLRKLSLNE